jgi:hypothetical protein
MLPAFDRNHDKFPAFAMVFHLFILTLHGSCVSQKPILSSRSLLEMPLRPDFDVRNDVFGNRRNSIFLAHT